MQVLVTELYELEDITNQLKTLSNDTTTITPEQLTPITEWLSQFSNNLATRYAVDLECKRKSAKKHRENYKEQIAVYQKEYYEKHKEQRRVYNTQYQRTHRKKKGEKK